MAVNKFWVMGDTSYTVKGRARFNEWCTKVPTEAEFVVHVGDIWEGRTSAALADYTAVKTEMLVMNKPVFVLIGDNEYNDLRDPKLRLADWRTTFTDFHTNWAHSYNVSTHPHYPEMFAFETAEGLLCLSVSLMAGKVHSSTEWNARATASAEWVTAQFLTHPNAHSAVIFAHTNPKYNLYEKKFFPTLRTACKTFTRPVLYLQGDKHAWERKIYSTIPTMTKITIDNTDTSAPLLVTATGDATAPWLFDHRF